MPNSDSSIQHPSQPDPASCNDRSPGNPARNDLDGERAAVVREIRREHEREARVPTELVEEISETSSEALPAWKEAKAESDFETFAPYLEELLDLKREYAEHVDPDADPYEVLFQDYEPYVSLDRAEAILEELKETLVPMIEEIRESETPIATDAFEGTWDTDAQEELAREGFYDGLNFHRVIDGFMAQTGDPRGDGTGGSGKKLKAEFSDAQHTRGTLSMARAQNPDSADSQFFIVFQDAPHLNGQYTVWGQVVEGMEHVDNIKRGRGPNGMVSDPDKIVKMQVAADAQE